MQVSTAGAAPSAAGLPVLPPRNAFIELAVFFVPLVLLDTYVPSFPDLAQLQPHPFWLPVLLLSLQYGTVSGLLAASVAIAVSVLTGFPDQEVGENHFSYLVRIWLQPMLWIAAALILGQFRMRQIAERAELRLRNDELGSQRAALAEYAQNLRTRCERLERRMAGRGPRDATALLDAVVRLSQSATAGPGAACLDCVAAVFPEAQASLYRLRPDGLVLEASRGWPADAGYERNIPPESPLYRAVAVAASALYVLAAGDEIALAGQGVAAVPILSTGGDRILGMLKLELVAPEALNASLTDRLAVVARQLAPALELAYDAAGASRSGLDAGSAAPARPGGLRHPPWRGRRQPRAETAGGAGAKSKPSTVVA